MYFAHLKDVYCTMDRVIGDILKRYGDEATIIAMSDHGFANFKRQFSLNTWLREKFRFYHVKEGVSGEKSRGLQPIWWPEKSHTGGDAMEN